MRRGEHDLSGLSPDVREVVHAALEPDPRRRPSLGQVRARLGGGSVPVAATAVPTTDPDDPYTVPLALATAGREPTLSLFDDSEEETEAVAWPDGDTEVDPWSDAEPPPAAVPLPERLRRAALAAGLGLAAAVGVLSHPWVTLAVLVVLAWLLRGASLAGAAAGARRSLRGHRWYDGPQLLLASPWHAVQAIPGALLLVLWGLGLALACALVCYALSAGEQVTLFASGVVLVLALWVGPGGSRFRGPVARMITPLCRRLVPWTVAWVLVVGASLALAVVTLDRGVDWSPLGNPVERLP